MEITSKPYLLLSSAMIIKTAESFVLKRQFPLGGLYTQEEMGLDDDVFGNAVPQQLQTPSQPTALNDQPSAISQNPQEDRQPNEVAPKTKQIKGVLKSFETRGSASGKDYGLMAVFEENSNNTLNVLVKDANAIDVLKHTESGSTVEFSIYKENGFIFLNEFINTESYSKESESNVQYSETAESININDQSDATVNREDTEETPNQTESEQVFDYEVVDGVLTAIQAGQKGQTKFVKMAFQTDDGNNLNLLAYGDKTVAEAQSLEQNQPTSIRVKQENGFNFFVGLHNEKKQLQVG